VELSHQDRAISAEVAEGQIADRLREFFESAAAEVETEPDGSKRLWLGAPHDQVVLTPTNEVVVVHGRSERDGFDANDNTVRARTTAKAANELTKLRFWRAVEAGLKDARGIGEPGKPAALEQWTQQYSEQAGRLRHQATILGLAAEKSHQFSARLFEPALLDASHQGMSTLRRGIALYYGAEILRGQIVAETSRRLTEKARPDRASRRDYFARRKQFYSRAAELYGKAGQLFSRCDAKALARQCADLAEVCRESAAEPPPQKSTWHGVLSQRFEESTARDRYGEARKLIEPDDTTLQNTVRAINAHSDPTKQENLKQWFASHLADIARRLKTREEVSLLLQRIADLRGMVTDSSAIRASDLERYRQLVASTRADVLGPGKT